MGIPNYTGDEAYERGIATFCPEQRLDPPEGVTLTEQEERDAIAAAAVKLLTRGRPSFGQCPAKQLMDEAWGELTCDEFNRLTDIARDFVEQPLTGRKADACEFGYIALRGLARHVLKCVDVDKAQADWLDSLDD